MRASVRPGDCPSESGAALQCVAGGGMSQRAARLLPFAGPGHFTPNLVRSTNTSHLVFIAPSCYSVAFQPSHLPIFDSLKQSCPTITFLHVRTYTRVWMD
ncbi:hypothetical protein AMECASPLE_030683 [Ameca splendens]|uniref:Uncharacterized protein n=1 Tax=Ameca splendens TaxID=208324 RepID=A0ABV0Z3Z5_9TELE